MPTNRFGLNRAIPEQVKQLVRKRCKFGCVNCRTAFYQYDHFDPEFKDAKNHDPSGICCLCPTCHQEVTSGRLSRELIKKRAIEVNDAVSDPITPPLDFHDGSECLKIGGIRYSLIPLSLINIYGENLLTVTPSTNSEPGSISGRFFSNAGEEMIRIDRNEIVFKLDNWDIEVVGRSIKVRSAPRTICCEIQIDAPRGLVVKKLDMAFRDIRVFANEDVFCVGKKISGDYYFWCAAEIKVLANRFRGAAIRVDEPSTLAKEWNSSGRASIRRPILRQDGDKHYLEFKTSGFPNIEAGFFSTAFLHNQHMAMDSYAGIFHFNSGIAFANKIGDYWVGASFYKNATLSAVRRKFRGSGPPSFHELAAGLF